MASAGGSKLSRDEYKKAKELDAARKAGTAAPELDEEGKMINPHIPQYISQEPWYIDSGHATLKHQRSTKQQVVTPMDEWYARGERQGKAPVKFRKGACENCGAMTHKKKDCTERPRKIGGKWTGDDLQRDEVVRDINMNWDSKRDRWNGFNADDYQEIIEEYDKVDAMKLKIRQQKVEDEFLADEDKGYGEEVSMPGQKFDTKKRISVRNLRIREDTAKYLRNLDLKSAYYDPKTRSMRSDPYAGTGKSDPGFIPENFIRQTGDAMAVASSQVFAWQAYEGGNEVHLQALPTQTEMMLKKETEKKTEKVQETQKSILEKYGGEEHLDAPPPELLLAQTEQYVEYDMSGKVIKGQEKAVPKTKYEEDVVLNNHREVWGSYWCDGQWGFACCYSTIKNSYCVGEAGKRARMKEISNDLLKITEAPKTLMEQHADKLKKEKKEKKKKKKHEESQSEDSVDEMKARKERIKEILRKEDEREKMVDEMLTMDERKRPFNSFGGDSFNAPTEEEMEAYRMKKARADDPMAQFM
eukprot:comp18511_c0_seq1/m.19907 comp18511_c0_seq1/g.19907  ORF comp18511_c0_seq1/g.19907 comp18511_c0_seq1/m.19907 type:complete len:528 (-) comp18511_c0_seq1:78-1661(-)